MMHENLEKEKINEFSPLIIFAFLRPLLESSTRGSFSWIIDELNRLFLGEMEREIIYQEMEVGMRQALRFP